MRLLAGRLQQFAWLGFFRLSARLPPHSPCDRISLDVEVAVLEYERPFAPALWLFK